MMTSTSSKVWKTVLTGSLVSGAIAYGYVGWCHIIGGCTFGQYNAEVILTNSKTQEPLANRDIEVRIDNSGFFLMGNGATETFKTDINGKASIQFDNPFNGTLAIHKFRPPHTLHAFFIKPEQIKAHTTISHSRIWLSSTSPTEAKESDLVELKLEIENWFMF